MWQGGAGFRPPAMTDIALDTLGHRRRRTLARAATGLFAAIGVMMLMANVLPHPPALEELPILGAGTAALVLAGIMLAVGERMPGEFFNAILALATGLVTIGVAAGGEALGGAIATLYALVVVVAAVVMSPRMIALQLVLIVVAYGIVVSTTGEDGPSSAQWLITAGALVAIAVAVGWPAQLARRLSVIDPVTGLNNRQYWDSVLPNELARAQRNGCPVTIAMVALDQFKTRRSTIGGSRADLLLATFAGRLREGLRRTDIVSRHGEDSFGIILPDCPPEAASTIVDRVRGEPTSQGTASAGIAGWDGEEDAAALVRRAERALERAQGSRTGEITISPG